MDKEEETADHPLFWSKPTIISRACGWLTVKDFGRIEQICKDAKINDDEMWKPFCKQSRLSGIKAKIVDRFQEAGRYRALVRYERTCVGRVTPSNLVVEPLVQEYSTDEMKLFVEISAFGSSHVLRLDLDEILFGLNNNGFAHPELDEPFVLGKASCLGESIRQVFRGHRFVRGVPFSDEIKLQSCTCGESSCFNTKWEEAGITMRLDLERPDAFCCLQPPTKNKFFLIWGDERDGIYIDRNEEGYIQTYEGPTDVAPVGDYLTMRHTHKAAAIVSRLDGKKVCIVCHPVIDELDESSLHPDDAFGITEVEIYAFLCDDQADEYQGRIQWFDEKAGDQGEPSFHHFLEEIAGMPVALPGKNCSSCGNECQKSSRFCPLCGHRL